MIIIERNYRSGAAKRLHPTTFATRQYSNARAESSSPKDEISSAAAAAATETESLSRRRV